MIDRSPDVLDAQCVASGRLGAPRWRHVTAKCAESSTLYLLVGRELWTGCGKSTKNNIKNIWGKFTIRCVQTLVVVVHFGGASLWESLTWNKSNVWKQFCKTRVHRCRDSQQQEFLRVDTEQPSCPRWYSFQWCGLQRDPWQLWFPLRTSQRNIVESARGLRRMIWIQCQSQFCAVCPGNFSNYVGILCNIHFLAEKFRNKGFLETDLRQALVPRIGA